MITLNQNKEMYNDFQLVYNNLASNLAPGLDLYEISMYLTKAQKAFVAQAYQNYEQNEASRHSLNALVKDKLINTTSTQNIINPICKDSKFYELPEDVWFIIYEAIYTKKCYKDNPLKVVPIKHDDFHNVYRNPYRLNAYTALKIDSGKANSRVVEIVYNEEPVTGYYVRYIQYPAPIILENLQPNDFIDGKSTETACTLDKAYWADIVRTAAKLAYQDYKNA